MIHLRVIAPPDRAHQVLELLCRADAATNVVHFPRASRKPEGDVILADVAREDASVLLGDLRELEIDVHGSIALEEVDTSISRGAEAAEKAAKGTPSDSVVWEQVQARTSEEAELSGSFVAFVVLATLIATVGILLDSPILIVGAMVVGPEFGPIAGFCVAVVNRQPQIALRSATALAVGFPAAMTLAFAVMLALDATGIAPRDFAFDDDHLMANSISNPDFFSFMVAACAGVAGMLSLTTAKSGALIGVLISVTTIPAAAAVAIAAAIGDFDAWAGAMAQLAANVAMICLAGTGTLYVQRLIYRRRRVRHLRDQSRAAAGLPVGHSRREEPVG